MLTMVKKEDGKQEAEQGYHDDKVMSMAIAQHAVTQVVLRDTITYVDPQYHFTSQRERQTKRDYGERIVVI